MTLPELTAAMPVCCWLGCRYGATFDWHFDQIEKAYILEGSATLTADDPDIFGPPVTIEPRDMVRLPPPRVLAGDGLKNPWGQHHTRDQGQPAPK
jgi:hypothetical protein